MIVKPVNGENDIMNSKCNSRGSIKLKKSLKRTRVGGHAWRKEESELVVRQVIEEEPTRRKPLGRPRLRWALRQYDRESDRGKLQRSEDRDRWQDMCLAVWS